MRASMSRVPSSEGLRSEALRAALASALAGNPAALENICCAGTATGMARGPNLRLAAAFGAEMTALGGKPSRLLDRLSANDGAPDTPEVFLPIAAAHGWVGRVRADRDVVGAWAALALLAGDERTPVRLGTLDALASFAARPGGGRTLLARAADWLELDDREVRFGAAGVVVEVFADRQKMAALADPGLLLDYLSRAIAAVATRRARRSARTRAGGCCSRCPGRWPPWRAACAGSRRDLAGGRVPERHHPDVREALSKTVLLLADKASGQGAALAQGLRAALEGSAKPARDPTRIRPGAARGKSSRPMR